MPHEGLSNDQKTFSPDGNHRRARLGELFSLATPIVLANLLQASHQFVNTFWVGHLGAGAVAAVSFAYPIIFMLVTVVSGLTVAAPILIAQHAGAGQREQVNQIAAQSLLTITVMSLALSFIGYFLTPIILRLLQVDALIFDDARSYLRWSFVSLVFIFFLITYQAIFRGIAEVRKPLYVIFGSVILNLLLDPLLIFGWWIFPRLGVAGAAVATCIAQILACGVAIYHLRDSNRITIKTAFFKTNQAVIRQLFRIGIPSAIDQSMQSISILAMTILVARFGTVSVAAYGIAFRLLTFLIVPAFGVALATGTLVGISLGARDTRRAQQFANLGLGVVFTSMFIVGCISMLAAESIMMWFAPNDPALIVEGTHALQWIALSFGFIGAQTSISGALRGAGDTKSAMVLSFAMTAIQLPLAWLLPTLTNWGSTGLWVTYPIASLITAVLALMWYRTGRWQSIRLVTSSAG